jgi:hypothetical protein
MKELGQKLVAIGIVLVAAFVLFKVVLGAVAFVAWIVIAIVAVLALAWAARVLL